MGGIVETMTQPILWERSPFCYIIKSRILKVTEEDDSIINSDPFF